MRFLSRSAPLLVAVMLALGLSACDMVSGREGAGDYMNDTAISTRLKSDFMRNRTMKPFQQIHVEVFKGHVVLSGLVDSRRTADKAIAIAQKVATVVDVKDEMTISGDARTAPVVSSDPAPAFDNSNAAPAAPPISSTGYNNSPDGTYISPYRDSSPGNAGR